MACLFLPLSILVKLSAGMRWENNPQTSTVTGNLAQTQSEWMAIFTLSCLVLQWSPGRTSDIILSPNMSTVFLPTLAPTLSWQAGLGVQSRRAIASEYAWLLSPSGPGRHCSQEDDNLSLLAQALTGFRVEFSILSKACCRTAALSSSSC